ncbi:MAG: type III-B CRISPR module-associated protein Cmr5 [Thermoplasmata archaeon]
MTNQTIEQKRALSALKEIKEISKKDDKTQSSFSSYIKRLPAAIVMNGLGIALAFEKSKEKKDEGHKLVYKAISNWLTSDEGVYKNSNDLINAIMENDQEKYLLAQVEALAYTQWLKMFSTAYLKGGDNEQ